FAPFFGVPYGFAGLLRLDTGAEAPAPRKGGRAKPDAEDATTVESPVAPAPSAAEAVARSEVAAPAEAAEAPARPAMLRDTAPEQADDLTQIKGVGPKLATELNEMGIYTFEQIAKMSESDLAWVSENLTAFRNRPQRDDWAGQAAQLLKG
ncbi:MAG: helix-hairpin-helix domain-containing protein, partial [Pseudomonadota bacterium]